MTDAVRLKFSWGLIIAALAQAVYFSAFVVFSQKEAAPTPAPVPQFQLPRAEVGSWQSMRPAEQMPRSETPPVNSNALNEMKQDCIPCNNVTPQVTPYATVPGTILPGFDIRPGERLTHVGPPRVVHTTRPSQPFPPVAIPTLPADTSNTTGQLPPQPEFQIALFVNDSQRSKDLLQWFEQDSGLVKLRQRLAFQVYTPSNALYRARYSEIVPVDQFPVVLMLDAAGGHVHAAGASMIPSTPGELFEDLRRGYELYKQAKRATQTGLVKTAGYSWDESIKPAMRLESSDCVDGQCTPQWRPGSRVIEPLFGPSNNKSPIEALVWANASELATGLLLLVAVGLVIFIVAKRSS